MPDFLQLDNALMFRYSNRYPRSFGLVIRLCIFYGITPVFIPIAESHSNAVIKNFNDDYNKKFFRKQWGFPAIRISNGRASTSNSNSRTEFKC
ncbi:MAG: hypothetical protein KAV87_14780 [Desulfobacteraceae bacterium]|nr:hypothetical protein [Desulfobacteraceae bacterium]